MDLGGTIAWVTVLSSEGREAYGAFGGLVWKWGVFGGWVVGLEVLKVFKVLKCLNVKMPEC